MKVKIELTKSQKELFIRIGTVLNSPSGERYFYMPFWFKEVKGKETAHEILTFEQIPKELINLIEDERNSPLEPSNDFLRKYPLTPDEAFKKEQ